MARAYWPGRSALGQCLIVGKRDAPCATVIGVVDDAHIARLVEAPQMMFFQPLAQDRFPPDALVVRVADANSATLDRVRAEAERAVGELLPAASQARVSYLRDNLARELRPWRLGAALFTAFGVLAVIVAAFGMYSVVAYTVALRTNEMGIRIALGARTADILDLVVADGFRTVAIGVVIGIATALVTGRLLSAFLFGVTPTEPSILLGSTALLVALALVACAVPGWRAANIDPASALRAE
jgi:putative ABC transport system permease protein